MSLPGNTIAGPAPARRAVPAMLLMAIGFAANSYVFDVLAPLATLLSEQLGFSDTQIGTLGAVYSLPNLVLVLVGGVLVDRFGIGRIATLTAGICLLGAVINAASPSFAMMALGRLLFGIGGETYNLCTIAAVTAWYPHRYTAFVMGLTISAGRLGSVAVDLSPTWAAGAYAAGWQPPLLLAAAIALGGFAATAGYWHLERRSAIRAAGVPSHASSDPPSALRAGGWRRALRFDRRYWYLTMICMLWYAAFLAFRGTFAVKYLQQAHGYSLAHAGQVVSHMFLAAIVATPLLGWISDRTGRQRELLAVGCALLPVSFALLQFAPGIAGLATALMGVSYSVVPAVLFPYAARIVEPARFGTAIGLMWIIQNLGIGGANLLAGMLNDAAGASALNPAGYAAMTGFFIVVSTLGVGFALLLWRQGGAADPRR